MIGADSSQWQHPKEILLLVSATQTPGTSLIPTWVFHLSLWHGYKYHLCLS